MTFLEESELFQHGKVFGFDLTIPNDEDAAFPRKSARLERKFFAITCHSWMIYKEIMELLEEEFGHCLKYLYISSPYAFETSRPTVRYIQIILERTIQKSTNFLRFIAGMQCNYRVTNDHVGWNDFLKRSGNSLEFGTYPSGRRHGSDNRTNILPQNHRISTTSSSDLHVSTIEKTEVTEPLDDCILSRVRASLQQVVDHARSQIQATIEEGIRAAHQLIPLECSQQRTEIVNKLRTFLNSAKQALAS